MVYEVYKTPSFDKEMLKLPKDRQDRIENLFKQVRDNAYVGDQLRYKNLREKRLDEKRIYYLVYEDMSIVLFIAIGNKKDQQATINHIIYYFDEYREYVKKLKNVN